MERCKRREQHAKVINAETQVKEDGSVEQRVMKVQVSDRVSEGEDQIWKGTCVRANGCDTGLMRI